MGFLKKKEDRKDMGAENLLPFFCGEKEFQERTSKKPPII
ncbi:hypothetical protein HMPREF9130_0056 [Peptoniphilus sp. oral taxon 375 str. F0436]|nr:hypothetical protein HMPREF9130_0056 [Peptoniphilus sp. oral taxon 375 str. F0436]